MLQQAPLVTWKEIKIWFCIQYNSKWNLRKCDQESTVALIVPRTTTSAYAAPIASAKHQSISQSRTHVISLLPLRTARKPMPKGRIQWHCEELDGQNRRRSQVYNYSNAHKFLYSQFLGILVPWPSHLCVKSPSPAFRTVSVHL